jgi:hypothetical protein
VKQEGILRLKAVTTVFAGLILGFSTPAFAEPDYEGYSACFAACYAAYPDRAEECRQSCAAAHGINFGDPGSGGGHGGPCNANTCTWDPGRTCWLVSECTNPPN